LNSQAATNKRIFEPKLDNKMMRLQEGGLSSSPGELYFMEHKLSDWLKTWRELLRPGRKSANIVYE
jgi:hypothetical protein